MIYELNKAVSGINCGGKAESLSIMLEKKLPVPPGFVILPGAFNDSGLLPQFSREIIRTLKKISSEKYPLFAVRSSAGAEDSPQNSFAGGFDSILNVRAENIIDAVNSVYASRLNSRAGEYKKNRSIAGKTEMAVIIQKMVRADYAGVVFSADPVSGSYENMTGNFISGTGDALVSGEKDALVFTISRGKGVYKGPENIKKTAGKLFRAVHRIEQIFRLPMDIEWAVKGRRLYILQARPVTTLSARDPSTGGHNDSLTGKMLWNNTNMSEAVPDVMTPATWSLLEIFHNMGPIRFPRIVPAAANIAGRPYMNISLMASIYSALGTDFRKTGNDEFFGNVPEDMDIPRVPLRKKDVLKAVAKALFTTIPMYKKMIKNAAAYSEKNHDIVSGMQKEIGSSDSGEQLEKLWSGKIRGYFEESCRYLRVSTVPLAKKTSVLKKRLGKYLDDGQISDILSGSGGNSSLRSLDLVRGISAIKKGSMTKEEYIAESGHRGPHEFELSIPDMKENPDQLDNYLLTADSGDPEELLKKRKAAAEKGWEILKKRCPGRYKKLKKEFLDVYAATCRRELVRSEIIKVFRLIRSWYLKAGEITGAGSDIFFVKIPELVRHLKGGRLDMDIIKERKSAHKLYSGLPQYPSLIRGKFDPVKWAEEPDRNSVVFDADADKEEPSGTDLKGTGASSGTASGKVRILERPEQGKNLKNGEILVAKTTNIGWTPLFLKAAGIITDIGAPLSHAAIVARELGIPAVVGCSRATEVLKTGETVRINGSTGDIEIINTGETENE